MFDARAKVCLMMMNPLVKFQGDERLGGLTLLLGRLSVVTGRQVHSLPTLSMSLLRVLASQLG